MAKEGKRSPAELKEVTYAISRGEEEDIEWENTHRDNRDTEKKQREGKGCLFF